MWRAALLIDSYPITQQSITRSFDLGEILEFSQVSELDTKTGQWLLLNCSVSAVRDRSSSVPHTSVSPVEGCILNTWLWAAFLLSQNRLLSSSWARTHVLLKVGPNSQARHGSQEENRKEEEIRKKIACCINTQKWVTRDHCITTQCQCRKPVTFWFFPMFQGFVLLMNTVLSAVQCQCDFLGCKIIRSPSTLKHLIGKYGLIL